MKRRLFAFANTSLKDSRRWSACKPSLLTISTSLRMEFKVVFRVTLFRLGVGMSF